MKFRCAVIGCGRIGCGFDDNSTIIRTHAGSYYTNPHTKLVSFCDVDISKLEKYGKKYRVPSLYTSSSEMFKNENIDCVSICTLVDTHLELVRLAAKNYVKAIFLEKPMSNSLTNAQKIIQICKKHKIKLAVDHQRRFNPFYQSIRKFLEQKKLGTIQLVNVYYGSGIANTGSHIFDVLRLFFGEVFSIQSQLLKKNTINPSDPNFDLIIKFANGNAKKILSIDIPSGLNPDTGEPYSPCIEADYTITFCLPKRGLLEKPAKDYAGKLYLGDIGIPHEVFEKLGWDIPKVFEKESIIKM